jgi:riboflavin kinase/FMN adenylyltransferase
LKRRLLSGPVVPGDALGRKLGFPTANVQVSPRRIPPFGVYRVEVSWRGSKARPALCSVGDRPTLGAGLAACVEVYIPGFSGDLYGKVLKVAFIEKLREQEKFKSLAALKAQIRRDVARLASKTSPPDSASGRFRARQRA